MAAKKETVAAAPAASDKKKALETAMQQIEQMLRQGLHHALRRGEHDERWSPFPPAPCRWIWHWASAACPAGRIVEIYGPESSGKTTLALHVLAEAQKHGRRGGLCGRRARAGSHLRQGPGRGHGLHAHLPAGHRRAGAWRSPRPWCAPAPSTWWWWTPWRRWCPGRRSRAKWATAYVGLQARLMSQALRKLAGIHHQDQLHRHLYQPAAREGGRHVRQSGGHHRRPRPEVLRQRPHRRAPHRDAEDRRRGGGQPHPGQGGEEQGGASLPGGGVRHHVRRGHLQAGRAAGSGA